MFWCHKADVTLRKFSVISTFVNSLSRDRTRYVCVYESPPAAGGTKILSRFFLDFHRMNVTSPFLIRCLKQVISHLLIGDWAHNYHLTIWTNHMISLTWPCVGLEGKDKHLLASLVFIKLPTHFSSHVIAQNWISQSLTKRTRVNKTG